MPVAASSAVGAAAQDNVRIVSDVAKGSLALAGKDQKRAFYGHRETGNPEEMALMFGEHSNGSFRTG